MRQIFEFKITYFKSSGKFYTDAMLTLECEDIGVSFGGANARAHLPLPNMNEVLDHLRSLLQTGKHGPLPGLATKTWHKGYIHVQWRDSTPHLIICD